MSRQDQEIWDKRYSEGAYAQRTQPSSVLCQWMPDPEPGMRALDLACGAGRNSIYLAQAGYRVEAVDISPKGLGIAAAAAGDLDIRFREADLESYTPDADSYDLIIMLRYVNKALARNLHQALRADGFFLCEEHLKVRSPDRPVTGPSNDSFRVKPSELLTWNKELRIVRCREQILEEADDKLAAIAQVLAQKKTDKSQ